MDITSKTNRSQLKAYFKKNAIPEESHFAELINSTINQAEDSIAKIDGQPVSLQPDATDVGNKNILNLYKSFSADDGPSWKLSLNPSSTTSSSPGLSFGDANGKSKLFISESTNGNVGIGTTSPTEKLEVGGTALIGSSGEELKIGNVGLSTWAGIAHKDSANTTTSYALIQNSSGRTILNSKADQVLGFRQGNEDKMVIRTGNVGIGTTSPSQKLEVNGNAIIGSSDKTIRIGDLGNSSGWAGIAHENCTNDTASYALLQNSDGTTCLNAKSNKDLHFRNNNTTKMMINSEGNVGIGTTSPDAKLHIVNEDLDNTAFKGLLKIGANESEGSTNYNFIEDKPSYGVEFYRRWNSDSRGFINQGGIYAYGDVSSFSSGLAFRTAKSDQEIKTNMVISGLGNVGIGTTSPTQRLHVRAYSSGNGGITIENASGGNTQLRFMRDSSNEAAAITLLKSWQNGAHAGVAISDGNSNLLNIRNGNVGIGTDNPGDKLDVRGTLRISSSASRWTKIYTQAYDHKTQMVFQLDRSRSGASYARTKVAWDGDNNWDFSSDESLKDNIAKEENVLSRLLKLDVKNYNWKNEPKRKHQMIGFVAQDVQPLFPALVGQVHCDKTRKTTLTLKYGSFGVLAVGAIKELNAKTDAIISKLQSRIEMLEAKLANSTTMH